MIKGEGNYGMKHEFTLVDLLSNSLQDNPEKQFIVDGEISYSFKDVQRLSDQLASALLELGLRKGDRVAIYMGSRWETIVSMLGISKAAGVIVNIAPLLKVSQISHIMSKCGVRFLIGDSLALEQLTVDRQR